jgi:hypothetical protein
MSAALLKLVELGELNLNQTLEELLALNFLKINWCNRKVTY